MIKFILFFVLVKEIISLEAHGSGIVTEILQELIDMFVPLARLYDVNLFTCQPHPHRPDFTMYLIISGLTTLNLVLLLLEPFGLRIKSIIMTYHYPERSLERAVWLHQSIMKRRERHWTFAKREARRKFLKSGSTEAATCLEALKTWLDR